MNRNRHSATHSVYSTTVGCRYRCIGNWWRVYSVDGNGTGARVCHRETEGRMCGHQSHLPPSENGRLRAPNRVTNWRTPNTLLHRGANDIGGWSMLPKTGLSGQLWSAQTNSDGRRDAPTTSTTIAVVTLCRRRCNSVYNVITNKYIKANGRTDERTDAGNRIWCILALKCDIWWQ